MPVLSTDLIDVKFSKDMPVQPLDAMEASKAGGRAGLATEASALKLSADICCAGLCMSKGREGRLKCLLDKLVLDKPAGNPWHWPTVSCPREHRGDREIDVGRR